MPPKTKAGWRRLLAALDRAGQVYEVGRDADGLTFADRPPTADDVIALDRLAARLHRRQPWRATAADLQQEVLRG